MLVLSSKKNLHFNGFLFRSELPSLNRRDNEAMRKVTRGNDSCGFVRRRHAVNSSFQMHESEIENM